MRDPGLSAAIDHVLGVIRYNSTSIIKSFLAKKELGRPETHGLE